MRRQPVPGELLPGGKPADVDRDHRDQRTGDVVCDVVPAEVDRGHHGEREEHPQAPADPGVPHGVVGDQRCDQGDRHVQGREPGHALHAVGAERVEAHRGSAVEQGVLQLRHPVSGRRHRPLGRAALGSLSESRTILDRKSLT